MSRQTRSALDAALFVIETLRKSGHGALLAGGCVRDRLLGVPPKDYDVASDATPARLQELFPGSRQVGAKFGVILVRKYGHDVEVATFRADGTYTDGRHPDTVVFGTEREDALRRDFTINGLFFDPVGNRVIDYVEGEQDLRAGVVRTIGDPERRFTEDHLRMLRAVRFAARFGFQIHPQTFEAIVRHAARLSTISAERVCQELEWILTHPSRAAGWSVLVRSGLRDHLAASWNAGDDDVNVIEARLAALPAEEISPAAAMAAVLCDRSLTTVRRICRELRLSNQAAGDVEFLTSSLPACRRAEVMELADFKALMSHPAWEALPALFRAELIAQGESPRPHETLTSRASSIPADRVSPPPLLSGDDLCAMGVAPGPAMGTILKSLYRAQQNEQVRTVDEAREMARMLLKAS